MSDLLNIFSLDPARKNGAADMRENGFSPDTDAKSDAFRKELNSYTNNTDSKEYSKTDYGRAEDKSAADSEKFAGRPETTQDFDKNVTRAAESPSTEGTDASRSTAEENSQTPLAERAKEFFSSLRRLALGKADRNDLKTITSFLQPGLSKEDADKVADTLLTLLDGKITFEQAQKKLAGTIEPGKLEKLARLAKEFANLETKIAKDPKLQPVEGKVKAILTQFLGKEDAKDVENILKTARFDEILLKQKRLKSVAELKQATSDKTAVRTSQTENNTKPQGVLEALAQQANQTTKEQNKAVTGQQKTFANGGEDNVLSFAKDALERGEARPARQSDGKVSLKQTLHQNNAKATLDYTVGAAGKIQAMDARGGPKVNANLNAQTALAVQAMANAGAETGVQQDTLDMNMSGKNTSAELLFNGGNLQGLHSTQSSHSFDSNLAQASRAANYGAAEQVAVNINKAVKGGADKIRIQLKPAELGQVDVELKIQNGNSVKAVIHAERPETLQLLQRDVAGLQRALQEAGLEANANFLDFNLKGEGQGHNTGQQTAGLEGITAPDGTELAEENTDAMLSEAYDIAQSAKQLETYDGKKPINIVI